jgi:transcription termination/antitermination protein NusG
MQVRQGARACVRVSLRQGTAMKRISENPPARFPQRSIHESEGVWWIAKVKSRQEKALAFDLIKENIEYYLPLYTKVTRRHDNNKPRKSILPLFAGYLSFCAPRGMERATFATGRVVNLVEVRHQKHFKDELEQVYFALDLGMTLEPLEPAVAGLAPGTLVSVQSGPLRGIHGSIIRLQNNHKLVLSVDGLGLAAVTVDATMVKPVER